MRMPFASWRVTYKYMRLEHSDLARSSASWLAKPSHTVQKGSETLMPMSDQPLPADPAAWGRPVPVVTRKPAERSPGRGAKRAFDQRERQIAARIAQDFPRWLVLWGLYSRRFWAFPCFRVPRGTIAEAANPDDLVAEMRSIQRAAMSGAPARHPDPSVTIRSNLSHSSAR
jgi:hypothetical protein